jgi:hypothetical protein
MKAIQNYKDLLNLLANKNCPIEYEVINPKTRLIKLNIEGTMNGRDHYVRVDDSGQPFIILSTSKGSMAGQKPIVQLYNAEQTVSWLVDFELMSILDAVKA